MEEKRKNVRVKLNSVVSFKIKSTLLAVSSRIKDASDSGMCFPSKNSFPVGTVLELRIRSEDLPEPIKVFGKVVRIVNPAINDAHFEVGLEFLEMPVAKLQILHDYIQQAVAQGSD
jgi:hypothetical protein